MSRSLLPLLLLALGCAGSTPEPAPASPEPNEPPQAEPTPPPPTPERSESASDKEATRTKPTKAKATEEAERERDEEALPPPLPEGTTVLHVGDSMADALGKKLHRQLKKRGIKSILEAKEATYIPQWAGHKMKLGQHIRWHDPDLVIITLGGNETRMPDPTERVEAIKRLVKRVGDRPCLWIAAPLWPGLKHTGILDVIRENCAPCRYVDTNELIPDLERLKDGVHPTIPERRRWAKFMIRWLLHNRDPNAERPWDFKAQLEAPPEGSEAWLESR